MKKIFKLTVAALALLLCLAGCGNIFQNTVKPADGNGLLELQFVTSGSRTILPDFGVGDSYEIIFTPVLPDGVTVDSNRIAFEYIEDEAPSDPIEIGVGKWLIDTVNIYSDDILIATIAEPIPVDVIPAYQIISIPLVFPPIDGEGTFTWVITDQDNFADFVTLTLEWLGETVYPSNDKTYTAATGEETIAAGYYLATITAETGLIAADKGILKAVWSNVIHIYPDVVTALPPYDVDAGNFFLEVEDLWMVIGSAAPVKMTVTPEELFKSAQVNLAAGTKFYFSLTEDKAALFCAEDTFDLEKENGMALVPFGYQSTAVKEFEITEGGWYTFTVCFDMDDGELIAVCAADYMAPSLPFPNLGPFTAVNNATQKGWNFNTAAMVDVAKAKYLILETIGNTNRDGVGGTEIIVQGQGNGGAWKQTPVAPGWTSFGHNGVEIVYMVIDITKVEDWDAFKAGTDGKIFIQYYGTDNAGPDGALGLKYAYLTEYDVEAVGGSVNLTVSGTTFGFLARDVGVKTNTPIKITFNANGGKVEDADTKEIDALGGNAIGSIPSDPVFAGKLFVGWFEAVHGDDFEHIDLTHNPVTAANRFNYDTNVYAVWVDAVVGTPGVQDDGSYIIDAASVTPVINQWGTLTKDGDTITAAGWCGVITLPFPDGFDINDYASVKINFFAYGAGSDIYVLGPKASKADGTDQKDLGWPANYRNTYLKQGDNEWLIESDQTFADKANAFTEFYAVDEGNGATGIAFQFGPDGGGIPQYKVKLYSIQFFPVPKPPAPKLVIFHQSGTTSTSTSNLEAAWNETTKRYTITNTTTAGGFGSSGITQSVLVYLDTPLSAVSTLTARVRITGQGSGSGVIMGMMTDPTKAAADGAPGDGETNFNFGGVRINSTTAGAANSTMNLQHYGSRTGGNNAGGIGFNATTVGSGTLWDDELIFKVERENARFTTTVYDRNGTQLSSGGRNDANQFSANAPLYPGFMLARYTTVEISQITIRQASSVTLVNDAANVPVFTTDASAPAVYLADSISFTVPTVEGTGGNYTYTHLLAAGNLSLTAAALPARVVQNISWAITSGSATFANDTTAATGTNAELKFSAAGDVVLTATVADGNKTATLTVEVMDAAPELTDITIEGSKTSIMAGKTDSGDGESGNPETAAFTVKSWEHHTVSAPTVTWSVLDAETSGSATTDAGTIDANTGVFTAATDITGPVEVWIFATSGSVTSNGVKLTVTPYVKPFVSTKTLSWVFNDTTSTSPIVQKNWTAATADGTVYEGEVEWIKDDVKLTIVGSKIARWNPAQSAPSGSGWTAGCIQISNSNQDGIILVDVEGPFRVTVRFSNTGSGTGRFCDIVVNGVTTSNEVDGTTGKTVTYTYNATGEQQVSINSRGGLRIYSVIIEQ